VVAHHGKHKVQSARCVAALEARFAISALKEAHLGPRLYTSTSAPRDSKTDRARQVLEGMNPTDKPVEEAK